MDVLDGVKPAWWDITGAPQVGALSELYHENSKIRPSARGFVVSHEAMEVMTEGYKRYENVDRVELPPVADLLDVPLGQTMVRRKSVRDFTGTPLSLRDLSTLLYFSYGRTEEHFHRIIPSAGGLFPLELYPVVVRCDGVPPGVYHYDIRGHELESVPSAGPLDLVDDAIFAVDVMANCSVVVVITGIFGRTKIKYGERGYRFALLEAGHLAQNMCLAAIAMELAVCPIGGFVDDQIHDVLDIDGVDEAAIYTVAIGSAPNSGA